MGDHTENEFLGRREHVEGERDFILISFALEPAEEIGGIEHAVRIERIKEAVCFLRWDGPRWLLKILGIVGPTQHAHRQRPQVHKCGGEDGG